MKRLLVLGALTLLPSSAAAQQSTITCPGETTMEMRQCTSKSWQESSAVLQRQVPTPLLKQWQEASRAMCAAAYAPHKGGTIYPLLVVGCDDSLNRALLKEFIPMDAR